MHSPFAIIPLYILIPAAFLLGFVAALVEKRSNKKNLFLRFFSIFIIISSIILVVQGAVEEKLSATQVFQAILLILFLNSIACIFPAAIGYGLVRGLKK